MIEVPLRDSNKKISNSDCSLIMKAIDKLNSNLEQMAIINLVNRQGMREVRTPTPFLWYDVQKYETSYNRLVPSKIKIHTSHYIGTCQMNVGFKKDINKTIRFDIRPRFGNSIFNYLLSYVTDIFVPQLGDSAAQKEGGYAFWLLILLWKAAFDQAITTNHIPRSYVTREDNLRVLKGRLDLLKHLRKNIFDQSRIYCRYRLLTFDNIINRTIRYTYKLLNTFQSVRLLEDMATYDARLASLGVSDGPVLPGDIQKINYTTMNRGYRLLMEICARIIEYLLPSIGKEGREKGLAFFLDVAELWENYIYRLLKSNLDEEYQVTSPNFIREPMYLFEGKMRAIRPDILICKNGRIAAVIDAKYKCYSTFGVTAKVNKAVSREDLYQMGIYLWHLQKAQGEPITGLFVSPKEVNLHDSQIKWETPELYRLSHDSSVNMGLINLMFPWTADKEEKDEILHKVKNFERVFVEQVKRCIS